MKTWKVLGARSGLFKGDIMPFTLIVLFGTFILYHGRGRSIVAFVAGCLAFGLGVLLRKQMFDDRADFLHLLARAILHKKGAYTIIERDKKR